MIKSLRDEVAMTTVTTAPTDSGMQSWQGHRGQHEQSGLITAKTWKGLPAAPGAVEGTGEVAARVVSSLGNAPGRRGSALDT